MEFVKSFTPIRFPNFSILPKKSDFFWQKLRMEDVVLIFFEEKKLSVFCAIIYYKTNSLKLFLRKLKPEFSKFHRKGNLLR